MPLISGEPPDSSSRSSDKRAEDHEHVLRSLELFAGPGGLALGVHLAGFQHLAVIEREMFAAETLRRNSQRLLNLEPEHVIHRDAKDVDYQRFLNKVDLLAAGPPCQPFSNGGKSLGPRDPRNMFPLLLDIVPKVMPRAILIENVKGLTRDVFKGYFDYVILRLRFPFCLLEEDESWEVHLSRLKQLRDSCYPNTMRYVVGYQIVNAADFGVPQKRERVLIHAFRCDLQIEPFQLLETHSGASLFYEQWVSGVYWERHRLQRRKLEECVSERDLKKGQKLIKQRHHNAELFQRRPWRTVRDAITDLPPPVQPGQDPVIANHVQHPGARVYKGHTGSDMDLPAKALKAGDHGTPGGENMVRVPDTNGVRYFTTREAARLQTFPDAWWFDGTWSAWIQQLGNAVPVHLATLFAREIHARLLSKIAETTEPMRDSRDDAGQRMRATRSSVRNRVIVERSRS